MLTRDLQDYGEREKSSIQRTFRTREEGRSHPYKGRLGLGRKGEVMHTKDV